jgi:2-polyprenyl-3-methyl-5-hydroxy-6-metoxy-1,4-benzoquinol methylase
LNPPLTTPKAAAADFHSEIADRFFEKYKVHPDFIERYAIWSAAMKKYIKPGSKVIDWGCGPGVFSIYLAENGCSVIGIDGSENMVNIGRKAAEEKNLSQISFENRLFPLTEVPAEWKGQDAVISSSVLEYIPEIDKTVQQIAQLVAPNGYFIVSVPNKKSVFRRLELLCFSLLSKPNYLRFVKNQFTPKGFNKLLKDNGLHPIETIFYGGNNFITRLTDLVVPEKFSKTLFLVVYQKKP